jgi:hypothetical protein
MQSEATRQHTNVTSRLRQLGRFDEIDIGNTWSGLGQFEHRRPNPVNVPEED